MIRLRSFFTWAALAQGAPPAAQQSGLDMKTVLGTLLAYGAGAAVLVTLVVISLRLLARRRGGVTCGHADCGASNDPGARFCRRCGKAMSAPSGTG